MIRGQLAVVHLCRSSATSSAVVRQQARRVMPFRSGSARSAVAMGMRRHFGSAAAEQTAGDAGTPVPPVGAAAAAAAEEDENASGDSSGDEEETPHDPASAWGWGHKERAHFLLQEKSDKRRYDRLSNSAAMLRLGFIDHLREQAVEQGDNTDNPTAPLGMQRIMYDLHIRDPYQWTLPKLAAKFGLDQVRVSAILRQQGDAHRNRLLRRALNDASGATLEELYRHDQAVRDGNPEGTLPISDAAASDRNTAERKLKEHTVVFGIDPRKIDGAPDSDDSDDEQYGSGDEYGDDQSDDESESAAPVDWNENDQLTPEEGGDNPEFNLLISTYDPVKEQDYFTDEEDETLADDREEDQLIYHHTRFPDNEPGWKELALDPRNWDENRSRAELLRTDVGQLLKSIDMETYSQWQQEDELYEALSPEERKKYQMRFLSLRSALGKDKADKIVQMFNRNPKKNNPGVLSREFNLHEVVIVGFLHQEGYTNARLPRAEDDTTGDGHRITRSHQLDDEKNKEIVHRGPSRLQLALREVAAMYGDLESLSTYMYRRFAKIALSESADDQTPFQMIHHMQRIREEEDGHPLRQTGGLGYDVYDRAMGWGPFKNYGKLLEQPRQRNTDFPMWAFPHPDDDAQDYATAMTDSRFNAKVRTGMNWQRKFYGVKLNAPKHELPPSEQELAYYGEEEEDLNHAFGGKPSDALDQSLIESRKSNGPRKAVVNLLGLTPREQEIATKVQIIRPARDDYIPWPRIHLPGRQKHSPGFERYAETYTYVGLHPKLSDAQKPIFIFNNVNGEIRTASWAERRALLNPHRRKTPGERVREDLKGLYNTQRREDMELASMLSNSIEHTAALDSKDDDGEALRAEEEELFDSHDSSPEGRFLRGKSASVSKGSKFEDDDDDDDDDVTDKDAAVFPTQDSLEFSTFDRANVQNAQWRKKYSLTTWADLDAESRDLLRQQAAAIGEASFFQEDGLYDDAAVPDDELKLDKLKVVYNPTRHGRGSRYLEPGEEVADGLGMWAPVTDQDDLESDEDLVEDESDAEVSSASESESDSEMADDYSDSDYDSDDASGSEGLEDEDDEKSR